MPRNEQIGFFPTIRKIVVNASPDIDLQIIELLASSLKSLTSLELTNRIKFEVSWPRIHRWQIEQDKKVPDEFYLAVKNVFFRYDLPDLKELILFGYVFLHAPDGKWEGPLNVVKSQSWFRKLLLNL